MRLSLAGIILLCLSTTALGQAKGEVESIGFEGLYRPNCWTPMRIQLLSSIPASARYLLEIVQEDLDGDHVAFSRLITLEGNPKGDRSPERYWAYFRPAPRLSQLGATITAVELNKKIHVYLCDENGRQLTQIPIPPSTAPMRDLDAGGPFVTRGTRLILGVGTSQSQPTLDLYRTARGITEDVCYIRMLPGDLPSHPLGYEAVDAILWMDGEPSKLTTDSLAAIDDYVRDGGELIVCQDKNWQATKDSAFSELLPVTLQGMTDEKGAPSLRKLAHIADGRELLRKKADGTLTPDDREWLKNSGTGDPVDPWATLNDRTLTVAQSSAKPGALVLATCAADEKLPYIARWTYGAGAVTWVAQNLGDPQLLADGQWKGVGWSAIWDKVFDWPNDTVASTESSFWSGELDNPGPRKRFEEIYGGRVNSSDLSRVWPDKMELKETGGVLVALTVVFFVIYWLAAGPGAYALLRRKGRVQYSWAGFALCAVLATGLTAVVVRLVLRGPPKVEHVTFVRIGPDGEAIIKSDFGLYIPRDGYQQLALRDTDPKRASFLAPYPIHPAHLGDASQVMAYQDYEVPMRDRNSPQEPTINVPYRSTLKKFQARWVGRTESRIDGTVSLTDTAPQGRLINNTGADLHDVYFIYRPDNHSDDWVIYLPDAKKERPAWPQGESRAMEDIYAKSVIAGGERDPDKYIAEHGELNRLWVPRWAANYEGSPSMESLSTNMDKAALLLSIFDRLQPSKQPPRVPGGPSQATARYEIQRRAGRSFDASGAIGAGQMLIVARSEPNAPLPYPLTVQGQRIKGEGTIYYQFIVPVERTKK